MSQVFSASFLESLRERSGDPHGLFRKIVSIHFLLGLVPCIIGAVSFPTLFPVIFGSSWRLAGEFAAIMMPMYLIGFVMTPVNMAVLLMGKQQWQLAWESARLISVGLVWTAVSYVHASPSSAVALHVGVSCVVYSLYVWIADRLLSTIKPRRTFNSLAGGPVT